MQVNLNSTEFNSQNLYSEYCIIGSGPAGITLALNLAKHGRVVLLEAGGLDYSSMSQSCYEGKAVGDSYFDLSSSRLRYFGGTSNHWTGSCRPLDEFDFAKKESFPVASWPIQKKDLDPYLSNAYDILDVDGISKDREFDGSNDIYKIDNAFTNPVRFKDKFLNKIKNSNNIKSIINSNLIDIDFFGNRITSATFESYNHKKITVRANFFIFCMGGIENSRMLLYLNSKLGTQFIHKGSPVGNYWMEHPHCDLGQLLASTHNLNPLILTLSDSLKRKLKILNCHIRIVPVGVENTKKIIYDLACLYPQAGQWALNLYNKNILCGGHIFCVSEQEPIFDNRIILDKNNKDYFNIPKPVLVWKKTYQDFCTIKDTIGYIGEYFQKHNLGRISVPRWVVSKDGFPNNEIIAGPHHMGGTRMSDSPEYGVVDRNCKVFGVDNLYMAGSSVFPTGGASSPTLTIVQLALRLADKLRVF